MKILCIIGSMGAPGGAQRVLSYLVRHFSDRHQVILLTFENPSAGSFYPMPEGVKRVCLDRLGGNGFERLSKLFSRPKLIRKEVLHRKPDVIISFMDTTNVTTLLSCIGLRVPVIISERIDPSMHRIGCLKEMARSIAYPLAKIIVVPTKRVANYFPMRLQPKILVIPNPVPLPSLTARPGITSIEDCNRIVAVGRLEPQKGFDRLIEAFALVAGERPDWNLVVIGEGSERPKKIGRAHV